MTPAPRLTAWAELLRVSALFTVPGDVLAGTAAVGRTPDRRTLLAISASLCLYEAGMALNDWADRDEDAADRPHRPIPSGRIAPGAALAAGAGLTVTGLVLARRAGPATATVATALACTVWAYDLGLKRTSAGPPAMAAARSLDLLMGAAASTGVRPGLRRALAPAAALGAHTYAVTLVSRRETEGGSVAAPLTALGVTAAVALLTARSRTARRPEIASAPDAVTPRLPATDRRRAPGPLSAAAAHAHSVLAAGYAATAARPLLHAALNPSPPLTQRAVGGGIRAMIPLQAALAARAGAIGSAALLAGLVPLARRIAGRVSPT
ncbi:SCO3242 family prenyltransferase [Streptomyces sp. NPDC060322]|uniref:SCO3242 family prenyltransferase n=1 Tax=unclassified Streptomyces TaxID=2593676 RepID=UPI003648E7A4